MVYYCWFRKEDGQIVGALKRADEKFDAKKHAHPGGKDFGSIEITEKQYAKLKANIKDPKFDGQYGYRVDKKKLAKE